MINVFYVAEQAPNKQIEDFTKLVTVISGFNVLASLTPDAVIY